MKQLPHGTSSMKIHNVYEPSFKEKSCLKSTRFQNSKEIRPPVPGHDSLACNIMAKVWNSVPELHNASSLSAAREISRKWAKTVPR